MTADFEGPFGMNLALVNGLLIAAVAISGVFPFLTFEAFGISKSITAFEASGEHWPTGSPFWFSSYAVGWVVLFIAFFGFMACIEKGLHSKSFFRYEVHFLAGMGVVISAVLIVTWVYVGIHLDEAKSSAVANMADQGNPFAALGAVGVSLQPSIGFWAMLATAVLIFCVNAFAISGGGRNSANSLEVEVRGDEDGTSAVGQIQALSELRNRGVLDHDEFITASRKVQRQAQLQTLIELRDSGVLTDEEFENAAQKIFWGR